MREPIYKDQDYGSVREIQDDSIGLHGYLVIGSKINGLTCGGLRIHDDVNTLAVIKRLFFVDDNLCRPQAFQFPGERFRSVWFSQPEATTRQVQPSQANPLPVAKDGSDEVIARLGEQ